MPEKKEQSCFCPVRFRSAQPLDGAVFGAHSEPGLKHLKGAFVAKVSAPTFFAPLPSPCSYARKHTHSLRMGILWVCGSSVCVFDCVAV